MTEYLVKTLKDDFETATLSRGYKRKTKGFAIASKNTTAIDIGDEPMEIHLKFPDITVAVGEERLFAIPQILYEKPGTEVIILDDAFQHRSVKAGLNILLTEYKNLFTRDFMLPAGDLRDVKASSKRAQIIIVTKCKAGLSVAEKDQLINEINPGKAQEVFFTEILYEKPYHLFNHDLVNITDATDMLLVCGIANPNRLMEFITAHVRTYDMLRYADHHIFTSDDLKDIKWHFEKISSPDKFIFTTEKDAVRLQKFVIELGDYPIYVLPIKHSFLFGEGERFNNRVINFIRSFEKEVPDVPR